MNKLLISLFGFIIIIVGLSADWTEQQKLLASDGSVLDLLGLSVSISGEYAIIGASNGGDFPIYPSSAYIFFKDGSTWSEQAKLIASDGDNYDYFGSSVSISGDYAIIGAPWQAVYYLEGSAYIYHRNGTIWYQQAKLTASDGNGYDHFGESVSISVDYAIIGAHRDDDNGTDSGSAYIFHNYGLSIDEPFVDKILIQCFWVTFLIPLIQPPIFNSIFHKQQRQP